MATATAYLVETIPQGLEDLAGPETQHTADVLLRLVRGARTTIDLTAVYWSLLHHPDSTDEIGFTAAEVVGLGATRGRQLYEELLAAAARGVHIRILQSPGFPPVAEPVSESAALVQAYPRQIAVRQVDVAAWYGGGIMHQKLWLVDGRHLYLGSANMDWRALSQVKELGLVVENDPAIVADLVAQFDRWWQFAALDPFPVVVWDPAIASSRAVPCWSPLLRAGERCPLPFSGVSSTHPPTLAHPLPVTWNGQPASAFTTCSPPALCEPGRTRDIDALRYTIDQAQDSVSVSVMHFTPVSVLRAQPAEEAHNAPAVASERAIWWPTLQDALLRAVCRGVHVRLLASQWSHSPATMLPHLRSLVVAAEACAAVADAGIGRLDVRLFTIPGWDSTIGDGRRFPGHTRVNHPKFVVTDGRLNVGTANMTWGDFAQNGSISLNTDHSELVQNAREIFDRDWESPYALPL